MKSEDKDIPVVDKALEVIWQEEQINATKDLMDMNDYQCVDDILEDIDVFNLYKD